MAGVASFGDGWLPDAFGERAGDDAIQLVQRGAGEGDLAAEPVEIGGGSGGGEVQDVADETDAERGHQRRISTVPRARMRITALVSTIMQGLATGGESAALVRLLLGGTWRDYARWSVPGMKLVNYFGATD